MRRVVTLALIGGLAASLGACSSVKEAAGLGKDTPISRRDFFEHGLRDATGYAHTLAGSAEEVADTFEEIFEATGSRGGFMIAHPQSTPRDLVNIVDFLVPELRRRGRFRTEYTGKTLRENLAT